MTVCKSSKKAKGMFWESNMIEEARLWIISVLSMESLRIFVYTGSKNLLRWKCWEKECWQEVMGRTYWTWHSITTKSWMSWWSTETRSGWFSDPYTGYDDYFMISMYGNLKIEIFESKSVTMSSTHIPQKQQNPRHHYTPSNPFT